MYIVYIYSRRAHSSRHACMHEPVTCLYYNIVLSFINACACLILSQIPRIPSLHMHLWIMFTLHVCRCILVYIFFACCTCMCIYNHAGLNNHEIPTIADSGIVPQQEVEIMTGIYIIYSPVYTHLFMHGYTIHI